MLVLPHPDGPTRAANCPFSIVMLSPVKMGTSRVGYLNHRSRSSIFAPPDKSCRSNAGLVSLLGLILKLRILFAAAEACAMFGPNDKSVPAPSAPLMTATKVAVS